MGVHSFFTIFRKVDLGIRWIVVTFFLWVVGAEAVAQAQLKGKGLDVGL